MTTPVDAKVSEEERSRLWHIKLAEGMKESKHLQLEYEKGV